MGEKISVKEYKKALESLSAAAKTLLFALYDNTNDHSASEEELAGKIKYDNPRTASLQIGCVGKRIAEILGKKPKNQYHGNLAWFHFVGGRHPNEKPSGKNDCRWEMNENLSKAIEELRPDEAK